MARYPLGQKQDQICAFSPKGCCKKEGGWVVDQQFVEQLGSPNLLAHGMGTPVMAGSAIGPRRIAAMAGKAGMNLMRAGRCFSYSHIVLGGPRVMRTTGQMGIATGNAASLCIEHDTTPRGVYQNRLAELRKLRGYED